MKKVISLILSVLLAGTIGGYIVFPQKTTAISPPVITSFSATIVSSSQVNLSWTASGENVYHYTLYNYETSSYIYQGPNTSFSHTGLAEGTTYTYSIQAYNGEWSDAAYADATPVSSPVITSFSATADNSSQISLLWAASGTNISYYYVYNYEVGDYIYQGADTSFLHTGLTEGVKYTYSIQAYNGSLSDAEYANATTVVFPPSITSFSSTAINSSQIDLSWTASGVNVYHYVVYNYEVGDYIYQGPNTSFSHTGLTEGVKYTYSIQAYNGSLSDIEYTNTTPNFPPTIIEVTPITTPTNDNTPDYAFSSDEAGTIAYSGGCTGSTTVAVVGNNPITFDTLADGTYNCTITVTDEVGNSSDTLDVSEFIIDTTAPVISLNGDSPIDIEIGSTYADAGAEAEDGIDGDITSSIVIVNPVDTSILGIYEITYNISDTVGNSATQVTKTVNVVDTTSPTDITDLAVSTTAVDSITLTWTAPDDNGSSGMAASYDVRYSTGKISNEVQWNGATPIEGEPVPQEAGIEETIIIDGLDSETEYYFAIKSFDESGNESGISVISGTTLTPPDITVPIIDLKGDSLINIEVGSTYADAGAEAVDGIDGDITSSIVMDNPVDTSALGIYIITYDVSDSSGNDAVQVARTVSVVDTTAPVITLTGDSFMNVEVGSDYTEAGVTVSDNYDEDITESIVVGGDTVDTSVIGSYTISYNVSDTAGNSAVEVTRTVNVIDNIPSSSSSSSSSSSDITAPSAIENLTVSNISIHTFKLNWIVPEDAYSYDIRYSENEILLDDDWDNATQISSPSAPNPKEAGKSQSVEINNLNSGTTYHFAMKVSNEAGNESGLSNIVSATTSSPASGGGGGGYIYKDKTPPGKAKGLSVKSNGSENGGVAGISWENPSDSDFSKVVIIRKEKEYPKNINDGKKVYESNGNKFEDGDAEEGKVYYYNVYSYDKSGNESEPAKSMFITNNALVRKNGGHKVYVVNNNKKQWITTSKVFNGKGYKWENVYGLASEDIDGLENGGDIKSSGAYKLIKSKNGNKVYAVKGNRRLWIPTAEAFDKNGYKWENVVEVGDGEMNAYADIKLIKEANSPKIYYVYSGISMKRWMPTAEIFLSYSNKWENIETIDKAEMDGYSDVKLIKKIGGHKVYYLENGVKRHIISPSVFASNGFNWNNIVGVNEIEFNHYQVGKDLK